MFSEEKQEAQSLLSLQKSSKGVPTVFHESGQIINLIVQKHTNYL